MSTQLPECVLERLKREPVKVGEGTICVSPNGPILVQRQLSSRHWYPIEPAVAIAIIEHAWQERLDKTALLVVWSADKSAFEVWDCDNSILVPRGIKPNNFPTRLEALCAALDSLEKK